MANLAQFTTQPIIETASVSVANTNRNGTGTIVSVAVGPLTTAGNGVGKMISQVLVQATATTTAGMVRFYISNNAGSTWALLEELAVTAATPSGTVTAFAAAVPLLAGLVLAGGNGTTAQCLLGAAPHNAEAFNVIVMSGTL
jgi:hypothetical protein